MKKAFLYIFICLSAIILMSHNTYATTTNVVPASVYAHVVDKSDVNTTSDGWYNYNSVTDSTNGVKYAGIGQRWNINSLRWSLGQTIAKNSYFSMSFTCLNCSYFSVAGMGDTKLDSVSFIQGNTSGGSLFITGHMTANTNYLYIGDNNNPYNIFLVGVPSQQIKLFQPKIQFFEHQSEASEQISKWKQEEETATNNIENQSSSNIGNTTNQKTQSLLGVFSSFVSAIGSISPSNCNMDFDLGHIDFGVQDLCSNPVPTPFQVITSIIVLAFTIPFVVHMIRRILALIREMQT